MGSLSLLMDGGSFIGRTQKTLEESVSSLGRLLSHDCLIHSTPNVYLNIALVRILGSK